MFGSRLCLGLTLSAGIVVACLGVALLLSPDLASVDAGSGGDAGAGFTVAAGLGSIALHGPNDGEPINSRVLPLNVETQSATGATLSVYVNDVRLYTQQIPAGGEVTEVCVDTEDTEDAGIRAGESLLATGEAALRVTVYLHEEGTSRLLSFDEWTGRVQRPWIELANGLGLANGALEVPASQLVLHREEGDRYYFLLASTHKEWLTQAPTEPSVLDRTWTLASGPWMGEKPSGSQPGEPGLPA